MELRRPSGRSCALLLRLALVLGLALSSLILATTPTTAAAQTTTTTTTSTTASPATSVDPSSTSAQPTTTTGPGTAPTNPDGSEAAPLDQEPTTTVDPLIDEPPGETLPATDDTVPAPEGSYGGQRAFQPSPVLWSSVRAAEAKQRVAHEQLQEAVEAVRTVRMRRKQLEHRRRALGEERQAILAELLTAEKVLTKRSIAAFVGADLDAQALIGSLQAADYERQIDVRVRAELLDVALDGDDRALDEYRRLRSRLDQSVWATAEAIRRVERQWVEAEVVALDAAEERVRAADELEVFAAGSAIYIGGARFPIAEPYDTPLIDSFGFPRMPGTPDEHWHEGIDLFAPAGTPLLAAERGVILRISTGRLGGLTLWLRGESGADWYYAHLASYAPELATGSVIEAGQVLGFVGTSGNAVGTSPHLHLELHPGGGGPVNPYPLLKVLSDRELQASAAAGPAGQEVGR